MQHSRRKGWFVPGTLALGCVAACADDTARTSTAATSSSTTSAASGGGSAGEGGAGGSTSSAGGEGGAGGMIVVGTTCAAFGEVTAACLEHCSFADAEATSIAVGEACQTGLDALDAEDADPVVACLDCATQATTAACLVSFGFAIHIGSYPFYGLDVTPECQTACQGVQDWQENKLETWRGAMEAKNSVVCENGWMPLLYTECDANGSAGGLPEECNLGCCNTTGCLLPEVDVGISCSGNGPVTCTCTAGANTGATFQRPNCGDAAFALSNGGVFPDATSLWDYCNL